MELAVRTEQLSKRYPGGQGIRQVSLQVPRGSIYGFLGPNGAGKTTTIRLLLGLLRPQHGSIELLGQSLDARPSVLARIGALVESPSLYPHLSGRHNLEVTRRLLGLPTSAIDKVLDRTGLADAADRRVGEYSLGMRQRLGIALALLGSPELLILDEPSNGLDPAGIADLRRMLHGFAHDLGITVLVSSHLLGEVEQVATHLGVLHDGELRFQGSMDELRARKHPRVRLRCDESARAISWLHVHQHPEAAVVDGWIMVAADSQQVPRLMHQLFGAGIEVLDMVLEQSSLETLFFDLTSTALAGKEAA
jgi:ABC-2 type transport system ATP-binding protein